MRIDICHISNGVKSFSLASLFMSRKNFCVRMCIYYKAIYDNGFGFFYLEIGRSIEKHGLCGVTVKFLRWEWAWYKKEGFNV